MRKLICGLVFVMAASAVNIAWAQTPGVVDPVRPVAVETFLCTLNTGKTMADMDAANATWLAAVAEGPRGCRDRRGFANGNIRLH